LNARTISGVGVDFLGRASRRAGISGEVLAANVDGVTGASAGA